MIYWRLKIIFTPLFRTTPSVSQPRPSPEEDYLFVEQPSDDFFCPVTMGLLLQPHLTSCCGKHLSQEAATRIQREGGACPLCKEQSWSTMFSKYFQRQVNSLRVFCRHEDRGCGWQGELAAFHHHMESCPMRDSPPMTELVKLPVLVEYVAICLFHSLFLTAIKVKQAEKLLK